MQQLKIYIKGQIEKNWIEGIGGSICHRGWTWDELNRGDGWKYMPQGMDLG